MNITIYIYALYVYTKCVFIDKQDHQCSVFTWDCFIFWFGTTFYRQNVQVTKLNTVARYCLLTLNVQCNLNLSATWEYFRYQNVDQILLCAERKVFELRISLYEHLNQITKFAKECIRFCYILPPFIARISYELDHNSLPFFSICICPKLVAHTVLNVLCIDPTHR